MARPRTPRSPARADVAAVKVIGLGGVGASVAQGLAQFLASRRSPGPLRLIDGDAYEPRNRERVLFSALENKAIVKTRDLARALEGQLPILPTPEYVTPANVRRLIVAGDCVFLCVDNHASRKLVGDRCRRLDDVVLISGGNDGIEEGKAGTFGNVQIHVRRRGRDVTNPIARFHPEIARPRDRRPDQPGCAALISDAPQLLFTNLAVASAMLSTFYAWLEAGLDYEEVYLDIAKGQVTAVKRAVAVKQLRAAQVKSR